MKPERGMQMMFLSQMRDEGKTLSHACYYNKEHKRCRGRAYRDGVKVECSCWCHQT